MTEDEMRETLAKALCVVYGDVIDEARPAASALLPVVRHIAAEELRAAARDVQDKSSGKGYYEAIELYLRRRADVLDPAAVR